MHCKNCGTQLVEGAGFCPNCGTKVQAPVPAGKNGPSAYSPDSIRTPNASDSKIATEDTATAPVEPVVEALTVYCHECGAKNTATATFCNSCGASMGSTGAAKAPKRAAKAAKLSLNLPVPIIALAGVAVVLVILGIVLIPKLLSGKGTELIYYKDNALVRYSTKKNVEVDDKIIDEEEDVYAWALTSKICFSDDGKYMFYPRNLGSDNGSYSLCFKNVTKKKDEGTKIDSDVVEYSLLGSDKVVYRKDGNLYISDLKGNREKVSSDVLQYHLSKDKKTILYLTKEGKLASTDSALKKDKIKIDSDVDSILYASESLDKIYYTKMMDLYEGKASGDKNKIVSDASTWSVCEQDDKAVLFYTKKRDSELNYDKLLDTLVDNDLPADDYSVTYVMDNLRYSSLEYVDADLYCYKGNGDPEKLGKDIVKTFTTYGGAYVYGILSEKKVDKVRMSKLVEMEYQDQIDAVSKVYGRAVEVHLNLLGEDMVIENDNDDINLAGDFRSAYYDKDLKSEIFSVAEGDDNLYLLKADLSKKQIKLEEVCDEYGSFSVTSGGKLYYLTERDDMGLGTLYVDGKKIDSDVSSIFAYAGEKGVLYKKDTDSMGSGELVLYTNNASKKIANDVYSVRSNENGEIAVIVDYSTKSNEGDLKLYRKGKLINVDKDVTCIAYFE